MSKHTHKGLSPAKARKILRDGKIRGKKLTEEQRGFFGLIASGKTPTRIKKKGRKSKRKK